MRVLVCGGRDYADREVVYRELDALAVQHEWLTVIEGGARGADRLARDWVASRGPLSFDCQISILTFEADWKTYGSAAGPIRNSLMLSEGKPYFVLAFPGGRGTENMVRQACEANVVVIGPKQEKGTK